MRWLILAVLVPLAASQTAMPGSTVNVNSFDAVDTNKNGAVSWQEFQRWAEKRLHLKDDQRKALFLSHDVDGDSQLIISEFVPLALAVSQKPELSKSDIFDRLDRNLDGMIDPSERSVSGVDAVVINGLVTVADMNGDGLLSREEFERATEQGRTKTVEEKNRELAVRLVYDMDTDKDYRLSPLEVTNFAARFGRISSSEVAAAFSALDYNRDGFVDVNELATVPSKISSITHLQAPPPVRTDIARLPPLRL